MNDHNYRDDPNGEGTASTGPTTRLAYRTDQTSWYQTPIRSLVNFVANNLRISGIVVTLIIVAVIVGPGRKPFQPEIVSPPASSAQTTRQLPDYNTSILPNSLVERNTIANMAIGETRYVVPWAMIINERLECFLNGRHTTTEEEQGTSRMLITRTPEGFVVHAPFNEYWLPMPGYPEDSPDPENWLPVFQIYD